MSKAEYKAKGKCGLCKKVDEGILFTQFWFIKVFICETCISKMFKQLNKDR
jgi:hypothetical protein